MIIRLFVLLFVAVGAGCRAEPEPRGVLIGGRLVSLPADQWRTMTNDAEYARNFEAVANKAPRQYQILTVFLNQMTEDRRSGRPIALGEWIEVFISNPNEVTVLLRRDHGAYWLLSREMFRGIEAAGVDVSRIKALDTDEEERIEQSLRNEIDTTRHLLGELVAK